jgi:hypothetical protein
VAKIAGARPAAVILRAMTARNGNPLAALFCSVSMWMPLSGLLLLLNGGCIGVSQKRSAGNGVVGGNIADLNVCRTGVRHADDGAIDDFEDGNSQVNLEGGRDGYWWPEKDDVGSTVEPAPFSPGDKGADGSEMSLNAHGTTLSVNGAWGAGFGFNFVGKGSYDASKYVGIAFKARVKEGTNRQVRVNIGDINTHKDGNICSTCWNHFGKTLSLTPDWKEYRILFTDTRQEEFWGNPRPPAITPSRLYTVEFKIGIGQTFDISVDDLYLLACK